ncbi:MAG: hypothetical protein D6822_07030 [Cyanobacteria bacterium J149]|nr:MAG: hypothetical protein D6822_07030 [Cyanobacteria bacterium J149]
MKFKELCIEHIKETLPEFIGQSEYVADLGYKLTENENMTGSWYCSAYDATQDLNEWMTDNDAEEVVNYYRQNFGMIPSDPIGEPEKYHLILVIAGVEYFFNQSDTVQELWNDEVLITKKLVQKIIKELENL